MTRLACSRLIEPTVSNLSDGMVGKEPSRSAKTLTYTPTINSNVHELPLLLACCEGESGSAFDLLCGSKAGAH
jgi:hypothetical protein